MRDVWLHVRTGGVYYVICRAQRESDGEPMIVYRGDMETWVRPESEFLDGRFRKLPQLSDAAK